jgi:5,10-methylene-tetrahydrofolate dehydrogenase/methenyl tetrahydrofolate cyclohydrolase
MHDPFTVSERIVQANARSDIDGTLVFYPIFAQPVTDRGPYKNRSTGVYYKNQDDCLRGLVDRSKDVEDLCGDYNARWLFRAAGNNKPTDDDRVVPCTALSVKLIWDHYHINKNAPGCNWNGQIVSVVNRSEIMGRCWPWKVPLSIRLMSTRSFNFDRADDCDDVRLLKLTSSGVIFCGGDGSSLS